MVYSYEVDFKLYKKTFQVVFKDPNKQISNPADFKLELGNQERKRKLKKHFLEFKWIAKYCLERGL